MSPDTNPPNNTGAPESASKGGAKVELDIDDAPFLEEPEEEKPAPKAAAPKKREEAPQPRAKEPEKPGFLKALLADKKRLAIAIGGLVFVLVILPLLLMLILGGTKEPEPVAQEPERIFQPGVPTREDAPPGPGFLFQMKSFFVERRGSEGEIRFVRCSFSLPMDNPALFGELGAKNIAVRDAVYYYLRNKPLTFLADKDSRDMLKQDLLSVINEQISADKVQELYFEEYLVTGK